MNNSIDNIRFYIFLFKLFPISDILRHIYQNGSKRYLYLYISIILYYNVILK